MAFTMNSINNFITNCPTAKDGKKFFLVATPGFLSEIPQELQSKMIDVALIELTDKVTWVVFTPQVNKRTKEDQGRTVKYPLSLLDGNVRTKIYAILDDFHTPENIGFPNVNTQFVLTFLLPEEY